MSEVAYVETNQEVNPLKAQCIHQNLPCELWGLERTSIRFVKDRKGTYSYCSAQGDHFNVLSASSDFILIFLMLFKVPIKANFFLFFLQLEKV